MRRDTILFHAIWSTSHLNWTNPRACLTQSGPPGAAASSPSHLIWSKTCVVSCDLVRFLTSLTARSGCRDWTGLLAHQGVWLLAPPSRRQMGLGPQRSHGSKPVTGGPAGTGSAVHGRAAAVASTACRMSWVAALGWDTNETWEAATSTIVALARSAMNR